MALNPNLSTPPRTTKVDPQQLNKANPDTPEFWRQQAEKERAKKEYYEEQKMKNQLLDPPPAAEPPFQVSGKVNLGNFDIQAEQNRVREEAAAERVASQQRVTELQNEIKENQKKIQEIQLISLKETLGKEISDLKQMMSNGSKPASITEQLGAIEMLAERLGYQKPGSMPSDIQTTIELKKLELEMKREERKWQQELKRDERNWQIELKKLENSQRETEEKLRMEKERMNTFANIPERIGAVLGAGLMAQANGTAGIAAQPAPVQVKKAAAKPTKNYHIDAEEGAFGELNCPNCKTLIEIGPDTQTAVCAGCDYQIPIKRIPRAEVASG